MNCNHTLQVSSDVSRYYLPAHASGSGPVALMALIDCLSVINGHLLNMHIVDILTQMWKAIWGRGAISGEALISDCELGIWDGMRERSTAPVCRPQSRPTLHCSDIEDI